MKTVGYAIVGTGYFGAELGRIMKEQEGAKIVAVLDPENGQTIADELGCDVETDLDTLYSRDDVDAVIVATPNYLHKEPVVKAAEHGVNVFCEKPIALSYQDCDDMVRACQEHGVIFMAGHVMNCMLTDSRSFLSFPRHEYFRRILCNQIGNWVENGEYPANQIGRASCRERV